MRTLKILTNATKSFAGSTSGAVTVEFVLWMPVLAAILCLSVDATTLMHGRTLLIDGARDAARMVALGQRDSEAARTTILARFGGPPYNVDVTSYDGIVTATASVPFDHLAFLTSMFTTDAEMTSSVSMWIETNE